MAVRSLNKVMLIGNLTRDPELRYTPSGTAVCSFTVATNREWTVESGEKREEAEFTRIVSWNKLAELCSQLLAKGRKVYVEGRLQTRSWTGQDGAQRQSTEVVISDMIILDPKRTEVSSAPPAVAFATATSDQDDKKDKKVKSDSLEIESKKSSRDTDKDSTKEEPKAPKAKDESEEVNPDDIPF